MQTIPTSEDCFCRFKDNWKSTKTCKHK